MKKIHLIIAATAFLTMSCSQKKSSPLDYWKAGSANDDVFIEMTQEEMDALMNSMSAPAAEPAPAASAGGGNMSQEDMDAVSGNRLALFC